ASRQGRPVAKMAPDPRRYIGLVAGSVAQQEIDHTGLASGEGARGHTQARPRDRRADRELQAWQPGSVEAGRGRPEGHQSQANHAQSVRLRTNRPLPGFARLWTHWRSHGWIASFEWRTRTDASTGRRVDR